MPQFVMQKTKTLKIRPNGRSADFITPNFIYGCAGGCRNSYCYVMRHNYENIYVNENVDQILNVVDKHIAGLPIKTPNQTDAKYWTYDIGCSTDVSLHWKHTNWLKVFEFFKHHDKGKATFATKYVNPKLLEFDPQAKVRIRFSIMPQDISFILETKTTPIDERVKAVNAFIEAGYDVHLNFSPIVVYEGWLDNYKQLFEALNEHIRDEYKPLVKAEGIFLTHNESQHERNLESGKVDSEALIWQPKMQEGKVSEYGGEAVRYKSGMKAKMIKMWVTLHNQHIPWNTIRYIF